jgi:hypothetical protein
MSVELSTIVKGAAKRLDQEDYATVAEGLDLKEADIRGVVQVEAAGSGFDAAGRVKCLFEPHRFYAHLGAGAERDEAVKQGVAYPHQGEKPYPNSSSGVYAELQKAYNIDPDKALMSTSWGLGQIMGEYFKDCGYGSPAQMVKAFADDEEHQLAAMGDLIRDWGIVDELQRGDYKGFATKYNGPKYYVNNYDVKLRDAIASWTKRLAAQKPATPRPAPTPTAPVAVTELKLGDSGPLVLELQKNLSAKKYGVGGADGKFGNLTRDAVNAWKVDNGMTPEVDGRISLTDSAQIPQSPCRPLADERTNATVSAV